jgi:hypothetical protein
MSCEIRYLGVLMLLIPFVRFVSVRSSSYVTTVIRSRILQQVVSRDITFKEHASVGDASRKVIFCYITVTLTCKQVIFYVSHITF